MVPSTDLKIPRIEIKVLLEKKLKIKTVIRWKYQNFLIINMKKESLLKDSQASVSHH